MIEKVNATSSPFLLYKTLTFFLIYAILTVKEKFPKTTMIKEEFL